MKLLVQRDFNVFIPFNTPEEAGDTSIKRDVEDNIASALKPLVIHYKTTWTEVGLRLTILTQKINLDESVVEEFLDFFYSMNVWLELTHISGLSFELGYAG